MAVASALPTTFAILRGVLRKHAAKLVVTADTPTEFMVASSSMKDRAGRPLFVAGVLVRKNYVSYHLMPVYAMPALVKTLSPALRKQMHGKACFNFTAIEPAQVKELAALTKTGFAKVKRLRLPWAEPSGRQR